MTQEIWTDQELREATGKVREVLLGAVPPPLNAYTNSPYLSKQELKK